MDIEQLEAFAYAEDRTEALAELIPGSQEYYFYSCLHGQHVGQLDGVDTLLAAWIKRYGRTAQAREIERRQLFLRYQSDPKPALEHIRHALGLRFDHQRQIAGAQDSHPTRLDESLLERDRLAEQALRQANDLSGFSKRALDWLVGEKLEAKRRRPLLERLERPDHPNLVRLVLDDLADRKTGGFGSLSIHGRLLPEQLEALAAERPELADDPTFVAIRLRQSQPSPDVEWHNHLDRRREYLDRLGALVEPLAPAFNSLKAHVLYHRLDLDRRLRAFDRQRFLTYLRLPRDAAYVPVERRRNVKRQHMAVLGSDYSQDTGLEAVPDDQELVWDYLTFFLRDDEGTAAFDGLIQADLLRRALVSAKALAGRGDQEEWSALLDDPEAYRALSERVDIALAAHNPSHFAADDPVVIDVAVKNVPTLVVKTFEIDARSYYLTHDREIDTSIDLDGLVATHETIHRYDEAPIRRVQRTFELAHIDKPGVYVVELIGNGKSSRALIRKGTLRFVERLGAAGHVFTVLDENNRPLSDATIWLGGREHKPREDGRIAVPYSTRPGRETLLLCHGELTARETFQHRAERYSLQVGFYVDREQLLAGQSATVAIRPLLWLNGANVPLRLLSEVVLSVAATDHDGVTSYSEVPLDLPEREDSGRQDDVLLHRFKVPPRLGQLAFTLRGKARSVSEQRDIELKASRSYSINGIDRGPHTGDVHLEASDAGYALRVVGKSGEARVGKPVNIRLWHRDFTHPIAVTLESDESGRALLGSLDEVARLEARLADGQQSQWQLERDCADYPSSLHGLAGQPLVLPHAGGAGTPARLSLLEVRGRGHNRVYVRDVSSQAELADGYIRLRDLARGDYELTILPENVRIAVRVTEGHLEGNWAFGENRMLGLRRRPTVQIRGVRFGEAEVVIEVAGSSARTRVHVVATRLAGDRDLSTALGRARMAEPAWVEVVDNRSAYVSGRDIGDEYRYVLERRGADKYPGNLLERPSVLLNPWAIRSTATDVAHAAAGAAYGGSGLDKERKAAAMASKPAPTGHAVGSFANVDFLPQPASAWYNLAPGEDGTVRIPASELGGAQLLRVLAVSPAGGVYREVALTESAHEHRDLRLDGALDPNGHVAERKQTTVLPSDGELIIDDIKTANVEVYDSLDRVYSLFSALSQDATLTEFRFALDWPGLDEAEKRAKYSKYACHELNLFLQRKDPEFFAAVVEPHLRSKLHRTFMDDYLLDNPMAPYLTVWAYGQLNVVERILLAQRVAGQAGPTKRHIGDLCDLLPPDPERDSRLFQAAAATSALSEDDRLGFGAAKESAVARDRAEMAQTLSANFAPPRPKSKRMRAMRPKVEGAAKPAPPPPQAPGAASAPEPAPSRLDEAEIDAPMEAAVFASLDDDFENDKLDLGGRDEIERLYRAVDKTQEWAESNYYRRRIREQGPHLVTVNPFWRDFAAHDGPGPFLSRNLAYPTASFTEMMLALAVLDLPFAAATHQISFPESRMELRAGNPCVAFHREIKPVAPDPEQPGPTILVTQGYLRLDDRYEYEGNRQIEKRVTGELLTHTVYVCQVVLTNPSSAEHTLDLLLQIPEGAIPVNNGFDTRSQKLLLGPHGTQAIEYSFYFPAPGEHGHYPVHVTRSEALVVAAEPVVLTVVDTLSQDDTESWAYVSQQGEANDVLGFLRQSNIERVELSRMAWRMRDREMYRATLELLKERHVYDHTLWSYSVLHDDAPEIAAFLQHAQSFVSELGTWLESALVTIDPIARHTYEHLEYAPLVNARAHRLGQRVKILNDAFDRQYRAFLRQLAYRARLSADERLAAAYYLLLQDRVTDGLAMLDRVAPGDKSTDGPGAADGPSARMQYDYVQAYAAMYRGDLDGVREIAGRYADYPVDRWRKRFQAALAVIEEASGGAPRILDEDDAAQAHAHLAAGQATFDFEVVDRQVTLSYRNLTQCEVRYYLMDIELLFSRQPFLEGESDRFSVVRPNRREVLELAPGEGQRSFQLPADYSSANVIIEIRAAGQRRALAYYSNELLVQLADRYGQVRVQKRGSRTPLPSTYIKVYARKHGGEVTFYKDGYTDVRGLFDYASLSTSDLDQVERFAILIASDGHGSVIREAAPPKR